MTIGQQSDIDGLRRVGRVVSATLQRMLDAVQPGMTTAELDALGGKLLAEQGA